MLSITISGTANEVQADLRDLMASITPPVVVEPKRVVDKAPKSQATVAVASNNDPHAPETVAPATSAPVRTPPATMAPAPAPALTLAEISTAIKTAVTKSGKDAVVAVLATFGATKGSEVKAESYADFLTKVKALPPKTA